MSEWVNGVKFRTKHLTCHNVIHASQNDFWFDLVIGTCCNIVTHTDLLDLDQTNESYCR